MSRLRADPSRCGAGRHDQRPVLPVGDQGLHGTNPRSRHLRRRRADVKPQARRPLSRRQAARARRDRPLVAFRSPSSVTANFTARCIGAIDVSLSPNAGFSRASRSRSWAMSQTLRELPPIDTKKTRRRRLSYRGPVRRVIRERHMRSYWPLIVVLGGCTADIDIGSVEQQVAGTAVVSLTFDDTFADQRSRSTCSTSARHARTFYVNSGRVDRRDCCRCAQLLACRRGPRDRRSHDQPHRICRCSKPTRRGVRSATIASRCLSMGFRGDLVRVSVRRVECADRADRRTSAATTRRAAWAMSRQLSGALRRSMPRSAHATSVKPDTTLADLQGYVTAAEPKGGGWVPLVFHHVCDGCRPSRSARRRSLRSSTGWRHAATRCSTVDEVIGGEVTAAGRGAAAGAGQHAAESVARDRRQQRRRAGLLAARRHRHQHGDVHADQQRARRQRSRSGSR